MVSEVDNEEVPAARDAGGGRAAEAIPAVRFSISGRILMR
jgi:hypothetical protein